MDPQQHESIYQERSMRVICIGAGASGLLLAYKLQSQFSNFSLTIYEKNPEISGTWYENNYPGCACDVPAHNYTYSFEPKHDWSSLYASSSEIKTYFEGFSSKYQLGKYIKCCHEVQHSKWLESTGQWTVDVADLENGEIIHDQCDILINATGYLNKWAWPDVPGRETFKGQTVHSAHWEQSLQIAGKKVILIGNGSSAVQILPQIQPIAEHITMFVRSPLWMLPPISLESKTYSKSDIQRFADNPDELMILRKKNENVVNSIFSLYLSDSKLQEVSKKQLRISMQNELQDPVLEDVLIPEWGVGCRRLAPDTEFLKSIKKTNVQVVKGGVTAFTEAGCIGPNDIEYSADIIICATGYDTSFVPRFPILGSGGRNLQDEWATTPSSYLGIGASHFPNYFMFLGPYSPVANGPTLAAIEAQADHILKLLDRYQTEPIHRLSPQPAAEADFSSHVATFMTKAVYSEGCRSGHKNHTINGRVPTLWPGSTLHYLQTMQDVRADDWDIRYSGNRFSFLGNGISQAECDPTSDLGYYLRDHDDSAPMTRRKRMDIIIRSGSQPARVLHTTYRPSVVNLAPKQGTPAYGMSLKEHNYSSSEEGEVEKVDRDSITGKGAWGWMQKGFGNITQCFQPHKGAGEHIP
ncbi:Monooxygenase [Venustampulla echinocandica]|uniref:Monooxygenase n=1 Tax=Venustampulla echinocandica TaxID=2656787 RepID=A0A370TY38_9HELO|nr:Monooxygenase [Venustampulla echinocandica]RDL40439.1 Monooxygenase [Venustampulla echinocandica]